MESVEKMILEELKKREMSISAKRKIFSFKKFSYDFILSQIQANTLNERQFVNAIKIIYFMRHEDILKTFNMALTLAIDKRESIRREADMVLLSLVREQRLIKNCVLDKNMEKFVVETLKQSRAMGCSKNISDVISSFLFEIWKE